MRSEVRHHLIHLPLTLCALVVLRILATPIPAAAAEPFSIAAANVLMPVGGVGSSKYTVSNIPLTGGLMVSCKYTGPSTPAQIPTCTYQPAVVAPVNAGQTVSGTVSFYPYGAVVPQSEHGSRRALPVTLALAGGLLFGLRLRRSGLRSIFFAFVALVALAAIPGCVSGMTPYEYTITAINSAQNSAEVVSASTNMSVTVP